MTSAADCLIIVSLVLSVNAESPVIEDGDIFVQYGDMVPLRVTNITQFAAQLQWRLPVTTRKDLKAMRVNCTTERSLIEPYEPNHLLIKLYNPSVLGERISLNDLQPATQYSCKLVGALSLDAGKERLAILSETVSFSTLLEEEDKRNSNKDPYRIDTLHIILGVVIPVIVITTATVLIIVGYFTYRKKSKGGGGGGSDKGKKKFRMKLSKNSGKPPHGPKPPPPQKKKSDSKESRKKSKKSEDKGKGKGKPPPVDKSKPKGEGKDKPSSGKGKPPPSTSKKDKPQPPPSSKKKKKGHTIYSELQMHSSEDEVDEASKLRDDDFMLAADLGWDPTAYYPDQPEIRQETKVSKLIDLRGELSSPVMMLQGDYDDSPLPTKHKKRHHHHHHHSHKKPLY